MENLSDFQLYLFDFDGLLVNTERLHYQAYRRTCRSLGFELDWDFPKYCQAAHYDSESLKQHLYEKFPRLGRMRWENFYERKKQTMIRLIQEGQVELMPGVDPLLEAVKAKGLSSCVVTNSPRELIEWMKERHPVLQTIPHWVTREDYKQPKPHPECYLQAISRFGDGPAIAFEDTPRGIKALLETSAQPVLIAEADYPEIPEYVSQGVLHAPTLEVFCRSRGLL